MHGYRCGNCRKTLIPGSSFCVQCDSFFADPVPECNPLPGESDILSPVTTPLGLSRKALRNALMALAVCCILGIAFLFKSACLAFPRLSAGAAHSPEIMEALNADIQADLDKTMESRLRAVDVMLSLSTQCTIHHASYSRKPGDSVIMIARVPMTHRQARNRALFAAYLFRDLRGDFVSDPKEQAVRVCLLGNNGRREYSAESFAVRKTTMSSLTRPLYVL